MVKLVLNAELRSKLENLGEEVEFCDEAGNRLGNFLGARLYDRLLFDLANAQISDAELYRRLKKPGGKTLSEIWQRLGRQ